MAPTTRIHTVLLTFSVTVTTQALGYPANLAHSAFLQALSQIQHAVNKGYFTEALSYATEFYGAKYTSYGAGVSGSVTGSDTFSRVPSPAPSPSFYNSPTFEPTVFYNASSTGGGSAVGANTGLIAGATSAAVVGVGATGYVALKALSAGGGNSVQAAVSANVDAVQF